MRGLLQFAGVVLLLLLAYPGTRGPIVEGFQNSILSLQDDSQRTVRHVAGLR